MKQSVIDGEVEDAERLAQEGLDAGLAAGDILDKGFVKGIEEVGDLFGKGEFFLPELVQGAEAMKAAVAVLQPALDAAGKAARASARPSRAPSPATSTRSARPSSAACSRAAGFEVTDVGCDVPVETFVQKVKDENADLLLLGAAHHHDAEPAEDHRGPQGRRSARRRQGHDRRRADHARLGRRDRRRRLRRGRHRGRGDRQDHPRASAERLPAAHNCRERVVGTASGSRTSDYRDVLSSGELAQWQPAHLPSSLCECGSY